ncbi:MAG: alpha-amylase family glycosyl hydrolase [Bacteroidia bacterium]|nr:alpha-amylase family glycosyl hydrolase [Bacteroidia bacterium]
MKIKRISILALALLSMFTSCKDDDKDINPGGENPSKPSEPSGSKDWAAVVASPEEWDGVKRAPITYQTLVYSFSESGDFKGMADKVDYIDELGASAIWLSPIHPCGSYHGYDVIDYDKVNPNFGTDADFDNLIKVAHEHGIKVYLDFVLNHTSNQHPWFLEGKHDVNSDKRDYYIFSTSPKEDIAAGKIAAISKEGANGYNEGEWFAVDESEAKSAIYTFTLNWNDKTITVTEGTTPDEYDGKGDKYLWYGTITEALPLNDKGDGIYERTIEYESTWGFLVRSSNDPTWPSGTKYGAPSNTSKITLGEPFKLNNSTAANIQFSDVDTWFYHSHFYTGAFADLNYGPIDELKDNTVFREVVKSAKGWIDRGVDGFRLDAVKHIYHSASSDENPRFLEAFYNEVNAHYKKTHAGDIYVVGEVLSGANEVAPYYAGLPALFEFDFWYRLEWAINNGTGMYFAGDIKKYQEKYATYRADYIEATKLSNHDEDRAAYKLGDNTNKMRLAAAVLMTSAGEPYIYYGEEIGMTGDKSKGDENVRKTLDWQAIEKQNADKGSLLSAYKTLAKVRNTYPALARGKMTKHETYNENNEIFKQVAAWYLTSEDGQKVLVMHNFGGSNINMAMPEGADKCILALGSVETRDVEKVPYIRLGGYSSVVYLCK